MKNLHIFTVLESQADVKMQYICIQTECDANGEQVSL